MIIHLPQIKLSNIVDHHRHFSPAMPYLFWGSRKGCARLDLSERWDDIRQPVYFSCRVSTTGSRKACARLNLSEGCEDIRQLDYANCRVSTERSGKGCARLDLSQRCRDIEQLECTCCRLVCIACCRLSMMMSRKRCVPLDSSW